MWDVRTFLVALVYCYWEILTSVTDSFLLISIHLSSFCLFSRYVQLSLLLARYNVLLRLEALANTRARTGSWEKKRNVRSVEVVKMPEKVFLFGVKKPLFLDRRLFRFLSEVFLKFVIFVSFKILCRNHFIFSCCVFNFLFYPHVT